MSQTQLSNVSGGRDQGEMEELKKLILSEKKSRAKHHAGDGGGSGMSGMMGGRRGVDGGEASDDDEAEGDTRDRGEGRGRPGAKEKKQKGTWRRGKLILTNDEDDQNKYRDRAEERRKGHNPDYADKLNQMASMDAETSKYLGGDVEHTHLVKGLDYALLVKIREEEKERVRHVLEINGDARMDGRGGERHGFMRGEVRARTLMGKTVLAVLRRLHQDEASGGPDFKRVGYEFDLDPENAQEIPTAVAHSLGDEDDDGGEEDRERHCNYLMNEDLLEKVQTAFTLFRQHGGKARRHRKRAREKVPTTAEEEAIVAALAKTRGDSLSGAHNDDEDVRDVDEELIPIARKQKVSINIFEDVDDRYIPSGSAGSSVLSTSVVAPMSSSKGYFSGLRAANDVSSEKTLANVPSRAEMSATVKAAARAAAARLAGDKNPPSASASGIGGGAGLMEEGGGKRIERDIFAARPSRGQALGVSAGGYDVYPETGDFETYDSDEDTNKKDGKGGDGAIVSSAGAGGSGASRRLMDDLDNHPAFEKPKASFPFGVKKSEMSARKGGGSGKGGDKHRMDNKLNLINKYMKGTQ